MKEDIIFKDHQKVKAFFLALDNMLEGIEGTLQDYRPLLRGERYLTDREVSELLKVSRRTLQDYRDTGKIPYCQLGGKILYRESDIEKLLDDNYRQAFE